MSDWDDGSLDGYDDVALDFLCRWGADTEKESEWYGPRSKTLAEAIRRACMSEIPSGRGKTIVRHSHQRRIPRPVLAEAAHALANVSLSLEKAQSFAELFNVVDNTISAIPGVGELLVYDVAQRIGSYVKLEPDEVYLHTGTRLGAQELGLSTRRKSIPVSEFPVGLTKLSASQLEDVLCIYRKALRRLNAGEKAISQQNIKRC